MPYYQRLYKVIFIFLALLLVREKLPAQPFYQFSSYTVQDGLPSSTITGLFKDSTGFLWLLSENGLTRFDGYSFRVFTQNMNDSTSISSSDVRTMNIDHDKNIIFKTANSITRYNPGNETFTTLLPYSNYKYVRGFISRIEGNWAVSDKFLIEINSSTGALTHYPLPENLNSREPLGMFCSEKNVFIKTGNKSYLFEKTDKKFSVINVQYKDSLLDHFKNAPIFFYSRKKNDISLCSEEGLFTYDETSRNFRLYAGFDSLPSLKNRLTGAVFIAPSSIVLTNIDGIIYCINSENGTIKTVNLNNQTQPNTQVSRIFNAFEGVNGQCWISTSNAGIFLLDPVKGTFLPLTYSKINQSFSFPGNTEYILEDGDVIWISTPGVGLIKGEKYNPAFYSYNPLQKKDSKHSSWCENVRSISQLDNDNLIIGTLNGVFLFNKKNQECTAFDPAQDGNPILETNPISKIIVDKDHNIWFSRWDRKAVYVYNSHNKKLITLTPGDSTTNATNHANRTMFLDSHDWLWIGSDADFLYRIDIKKINLNQSATIPVIKIEGSTRKKTNLSFNVTFVITENNKGQILIGSESGFYIYDYGTKIFKRYINNSADLQSISDNNIRSFCIDHKNRIWIGTKGGGLNYFDDKTEKFTSYKTENGLPDNSIFSILEDDHGFLWLGTNKGLAKFNPENGSCRNFTPKDGIQSFEFNTNAAYKTTDGHMLFGGINGFNIFHPDSVPVSGNKFPTVITEMRVFDKKLSYTNDVIHLNYNDNYLSFQFASLNYFRNKENQYAYKMEGLDKDWIYCGDRQYTSYANLGSGDYTFRVKSANFNGIWHDTGTQVKFHIATAWWNTIYFRIILILAILTIFYLVYLYRSRQAEKLHLIRNRIARDLHDEVGSNLSSIAIFSEVARSKSGQVKDDVKPLLTKISSYTLSSMEAISDIVWVINANNDRFENIAVRMRTLAAEIFENLGCELNLHFDDRLNRIKMGMEQRKNFYLIYKEALNNIAKYARCNRVSIEIIPSGNQLSLKITDNGIGFDPDRIKKGNGLINMQKRAQELNGRLTITSSEAKGTSILLQFLPY